jgi:hypothetical protein
MANSDDLKVDQIPAAFRELAEKHNALVDLLMTMYGQNGVNVYNSQGRIVIDGAGPGGIPAGFGPVDLQVCVNGAAVTYTFLAASA